MKKLHHRFKELRTELKLSQEAMGAQGFVSTPGWIKIEAGQRAASEKLIENFVRFFIREQVERKVIYKKDAEARSAELREELLTLKLAGDKSPFLRSLAENHAKTLPNYKSLIDVPRLAKVISRGRPRNAALSIGMKVGTPTPQ